MESALRDIPNVGARLRKRQRVDSEVVPESENQGKPLEQADFVEPHDGWLGQDGEILIDLDEQEMVE